MKIAIVGAGIIGVSTAYELAADGHQVTVFERRSAVAEEGSFADAGLRGPGSVAPWAAPGMAGALIRGWFGCDTAMRSAQPLATLAWSAQWLRSCRAKPYLAQRAHLLRLALYSQARQQQLSSALALDYEHSAGSLLLLHSMSELRRAQSVLPLLRAAGVEVHEIDAANARSIEPALNPEQHLAGALHLPHDGVGNCRQFALLLRRQAEALGASFVFDSSVSHISPAPNATLFTRAAPTAGQRFDAIVVCAGPASAALLRPLGLKLPIAPVYRYSISAKIRDPFHAPRSAVIDARQQLSITRLGQRLRVSGSSTLGGNPQQLQAAALQSLYKALNDWFPGTAQLDSGVQECKSACAHLPDGAPRIGASGRPGIWLNLGHANNGWALGCGSARALADLLVGQRAAIDMQGLSLA